MIFILTSCKATKQDTTYEKISKGQDLEKVNLISFDTFFKLWVSNKKVQKVDLNTQEIYTDNQFTYFGKPRLGLTRLKWTFFKIQTDTLTDNFPNHDEFYGSELSDYLWTKVIPKEDKELWNYNRTPQQNRMKANCANKKNKPIHNFSLSNNIVILKMTWDVECVELERLKNKTYKATYDLHTKEYKSSFTTDN